MKTMSPCVAALALVLLAAPLAASADPACKPVTGRFEAQVLAPEQCEVAPPLICTAGRVWGGIQGTYEFVMTGALPADALGLGGIPGALFFAGQSTVTLDAASLVEGTDSGTIDLGQGGFASLISFHTGASGQIRLRGQLEAGVTRGDYVGQLCR